MRQAEALRDRLSQRELAAAYCSPLRRALGTAEIVAQPQGITPLARRELADVDHGQWSGKSQEQVAEQWPELHQQWQRHPAGVRFPDGESLLEVRDRALGFLAWARQRHADGNVLVITHGEVLQLILAHLLEMDADQMWALPRDNCGLSIVDDHEIPLIMAINDTCHLEGVRSSLQAQAR
jgi:broad specificity phosphatase PhoE